MGLCSATASIVCAYVRTQQGRVSAAHIQKMISLLFFLFLLFLPVLFLIVFLSKIKKMKPVDSEEPQNTPIEDTTESINTLHLWNPIETMKSASGKRPPDKAQSAPEKKLSSRISCA